MADDITLDIGMDPSGYMAGVQQISGANSQLQQSFGSAAATTGLLQRALDAATPKRAALLAWGGMAAGAAQNEQALSSLRAQTVTTGASYDKLTGSMRQLAREYPVGATGARQVVEQITRMGVSSAGSERRVGQLATQVTKLAGANGEGVGQLAAGMTDLARATGNTNLDPRRFQDLGDSLTTVSAKSGASATGILSFSKSIAPMAQSAGLGSTAILGISSSFARMGEDGIGATTAVSKMLTDMSRSVREGTPEMATYAQIVGKTSKEFETLFKQNPAEALNEVTEAISKAGPTNGVRMLEMLGLDGQRTLRSLTALTNQGGTRGAIDTAVKAYGSGSTDKAAEAAYGGLSDSFQELQSTAGQLSDALGRPLLGPLTAFVNALKIPTNLLRGAAESGAAQKGIAGLAWLATGIMGVRAVLGPLAALGLGRQALTSGPLRSLAAGYAAGRGVPAGSTFLSRYGAGASRAAVQGRLGPFNERLRQFGINAGQGRGPSTGGSGRTFGDRLRMGAGAFATGAQLNAAMITGGLYNGSQADFTKRIPFTGNIGGPWRGFGTELKDTWNTRNAGRPQAVQPMLPTHPLALLRANLLGANATSPAAARAALGIPANMVLPTGHPLSQLTSPLNAPVGFKALDAAAKNLSARLLVAGQNTNLFGRTLAAVGRVGLSAGMMSGRLAADGAGMMVKGGRALMSTAGGPVGLAMMAGYGGYTIAQRSKASREAEDSDYFQRDISSTLNRYRDSIGKASGSAVTHASITDNMGKNLAAGVSDLASAIKVTSEDRAVARSGKVVNRFLGNDANDVASQVRNISPTGMAPDEVQAMKVDLLRQYKDPQFVSSVLQQATAGYSSKTITGSGGQDYRNVLAVSKDQSAPHMGTDSNLTKVLGGLGLTSNSLEDYDTKLALPGWMRGIQGASSAGGWMHRNSLSKEQQETISGVGDARRQRYQAQTATYGVDYAEQEQLKGANEALAAAKKTGNADVYRQVVKDITADLSGKEGGYEISSRDLDDAGGNIGKALAKVDKQYASIYKDQQKRGEIKPEEIQSAVSRNLASVAPMLSGLFDARNTNPANQAVAASLAQPGDLSKLDDAAQAMVDAALSTSKPLEDLALEATHAANNLSEASQEFAIVKAAQAKAEQGMRVQALNMSPTDSRQRQYDYQYGLATQDAKNPTQRAQKEAAKDAVLSMAEEDRQRMVGRLEVQRQYEKTVTRMNRDSKQQLSYAEADYDRQVERMNRNANTQKERANKQFNLQQARAQEDFGIQRTRQLANFQRAEARQEQDFNIGRARQMRDYTLGVRRQEQDFETQVSRQRRDFSKQESRQIEDFNTTRGRQVRDYNIQLQRGEADYLKGRERQLRDFNISMKRQVEDMAKSLMDPYKRIQTQATWDGRNLLVNLGEQNRSMTKQLTQLDALRQAGLSAKAIDQLGLGKVENAQQVNNLASDVSGNLGLIQELNAAAVEREKIAAQFQSDPSNKDTQRAREDFEKSLSDSEEDYKKSIERGRQDLQRSLADSSEDFRKSLNRQRADFSTSLADQEADLRKSMARGREDLARTMADQAADFEKQRVRNRADLNRTMSEQEADFRRSMARSSADFNTSMSNTAADLKTSLGDMEKDYQTSISRQKKSLATSLADMGRDIKDADKVISGDMTALADAVNKAVHGKAVSWQGILQKDTESWISNMQSKVIPKVANLFSAFGVPTTAGNGGTAPTGYGDTGTGRYRGLAEGGRVEGFSPHKKADNVPILATAGEFMHPVDTVQYYGVDTMEALRRRSIPKEVINGYAEGGLIAFGDRLKGLGYDVSEHPRFGGVHPVHTPGSQHYNRLGPGGGGAIDVNADPFNSPFKDEKAAIDKIIGLAGQYGLRSIWQVASHFDHAHFDIGNGDNMLGNAVSDLAVEVTKAFNVDDLFKGFPAGQSSVYKTLTENWKTGFQKLYGELLSNPAGDTGASSALAQANQQIARSMMGQYGFGADQMTALVKLWNGESGWNQFADNPTSDAYGIPQALPGSKMSSAGADWKTNARTQIKWGLGYIKDRYGNPAEAWRQWNSRSPHWYDNGGFLQPGATHVMNGTGEKEPVLTNGQWQDISTLADLGASMVTAEQGKQLAAANCTHMTVNNNQTYTYDNRNDFGGAQITVQSQDPDDMARKLEKKTVSGRLTQTRGVRWGNG